MSNLKTLTALLAATIFTGAASAQDVIVEAPAEDVPAAEFPAENFASADLDQDGSLNADEFVTFAVMQADDGDAGFKDLVLSGQYAPAFTAHDADASGGLDPSELGKPETHMRDTTGLDSEEMETEAPEQN